VRDRLRTTRDGETRATGPFYSMFNVGLYTDAPFKVVWNRMGVRLSAAVVGAAEGKLVLPQETHAFFPVSSQEEGDYLAALLNS
ncbi:type I restriction endonuclease subunit M, partial [Staphylococcus pseudintermedius]